MHAAAYEFVATQTRNRKWRHVVELGGRNVNGTIRNLFDTVEYTAVDIAPGEGVDVVADAASWQPDHKVDCVVCCEVLEHTPQAREIVFNAAMMLEPNGWLYVTAACDPRAPHSGVDGAAVGDGEHYQNIDPSDLIDWMTVSGFTSIQVRVLPEGDVQAAGRRCG